MPDFDPKCVRFTQNWTNPGLFQIRIQFILAPRAKMNWNLVWKSLGFVQFRIILTHLMAKFVESETTWHARLRCEPWVMFTQLTSDPLTSWWPLTWLVSQSTFTLIYIYSPGMSNLTSKFGKIGPKWTNLGFFKIRFSTVWLAEPKCTETFKYLSHLGPIWHNLDVKFDILDRVQSLAASLERVHQDRVVILAKKEPNWYHKLETNFMSFF